MCFVKNDGVEMVSVTGKTTMWLGACLGESS